MDNHEFFALCQLNPEWHIERTSEGDLVIMAPTGGWTSSRNFTLQTKMEEYIANGAGLGWLINPQERKVYVYRPQIEVRCLEDATTVSGEPLLPGFTLEVQRLWS